MSQPTGLSTDDASLDDWREIMLLLDTALELDAPGRASWLASMAEQRSAQAKLIPALQRLLATQGSADYGGFMARPKNSAQAMADDTAMPGLQPMPALVPQAHVGPYRLLRAIGEGGMATVWLAERADGLIERPVALKLPHVSWNSAYVAGSMARERSILGSLTHPNIARLYDAGLAVDGRPFLALEYVDGQPIDTHASTRSLNVPERVALIVQVARALAYAHAQLVVHGDLKPSNILVDAQGQVHLLDFGIARLLHAPRAGDNIDGSDGARTLTQTHGRALTPDYASPEQIRGDAIGTASDVYSLGIVLFELLVGERPYRLPRDLGPAALAEAAARIEPARPSAAATDAATGRRLQGDLDAIVARALRKAPGERYATIDALADDLDRHLRGDPVKARPDSHWYLADRWVRRHKLETAVAVAILIAIPAGAAAQAAVLVAIGIGAGLALWQMRVARRQAQMARSEAARAERVKDFTLSILQGANTDSGAGAATTATDLLKAAHARIERELGRHPETAVELMTSIGDGLLGLAQLDEAATVMHKAVDLARRSLGPAHPHTVMAMVVSGAVLVERDQLKESIALLVPAIAEARLQGTTHALVEGLRWLGQARMKEGDVEGGLACIQEAVGALTEAGDGAHPLDGVTVYASLASALNVTQRPGVADAARRSLAHARAVYGDRVTESTLMVRLLMSMGMSSEGDDAAALAELDSVLADTIDFLGPEYPKIAHICNYRGHVRHDTGDVVGAIEDFRRQVAAIERFDGATGPNLGLGHAALGKALAANGEGLEAIEHYDAAIRLLSESIGPDNVYVLRSKSVRASVFARLGRLDEADEGFAAIAEVAWAGGEVDRVAHLGRVAALRSLQGRHEAAVELARASVEGSSAHPAKMVRAGAAGMLGHVLLAAGRAHEATEPLREATRLYAEKQLRVSPEQATAIAALARAELASASLQPGIEGSTSVAN